MPNGKMPISAEQWRASVGAANASRRPCQPKRRLQCWEVFLRILVALLVSTLLPGGSGRGIASRSEYTGIGHLLLGVLEQSKSYNMAFNATDNDCMLNTVCLLHNVLKLVV